MRLFAVWLYYRILVAWYLLTGDKNRAAWVTSRWLTAYHQAHGDPQSLTTICTRGFSQMGFKKMESVTLSNPNHLLVLVNRYERLEAWEVHRHYLHSFVCYIRSLEGPNPIHVRTKYGIYNLVHTAEVDNA